MSSQPSDNALIQQLQLLLTGYGYNFYSQTNQARADDLLVRERASYYLSQSVAALAQLRSDYHTRFVPPLTRANPDPPQEAMAQLRAIEAAQQTLAKIEASIRGMAVPSQDRIWWRFRQEQPLLMRLLNFDLTLVRDSEQIYQYVSRMSPEDWSNQSAMLRQMTQHLTLSVTERERFLLLPL